MSTILFIEPDEKLNRRVKRELSRLGHEVAAYTDPEKALATAKNLRFDLMITEYQMPTLKGTELVRSVIPLQLVPVIITSEKTADVLEETISRAPIPLRTVKKPYKIEDLVRQIDKAMTKHWDQ